MPPMAYAPNESTTPALKARGARRAALGSGAWVRGGARFNGLDWAKKPGLVLK
jgi:hypothetical protein